MKNCIEMSTTLLAVVVALACGGCGGSGGNAGSSGMLGSPDVTVPVGGLLGAYQNPTDSTPASVLYGVVNADGSVTPSSFEKFTDELKTAGSSTVYGTVGNKLNSRNKGGWMTVSLIGPGQYKVSAYYSTLFAPHEFTVTKGENGEKIASDVTAGEPDPSTAEALIFTLLPLAAP